jgi:hypothetical protein
MAALIRTLCVWVIIALGLVAIVGSGGGGDGGDGGCLSNPDPCIVAALNQGSPGVNQVQVHPERGTVQVGADLVFTAYAAGPGLPSYQWRRSTDGGLSYADLAGATGETYRLSSASPADEGTLLQVQVRGGGVAAATSNAAAVLVSSMPGVVFEDGDFRSADWSVDAIASPTLNGPTHSESREATGEIPGVFRKMVYQMPGAPSSVRAFQVRQQAVYDPAVQGAVHAIDYHEDCTVLSIGYDRMLLGSYLLIEQDGRRFVATIGKACMSRWIPFVDGSSLLASDFVFVDGPACAVDQPCPDFSASGKPLRFGFERRVQTQPWVHESTTIEHGIDNWKVTVWRR